MNQEKTNQCILSVKDLVVQYEADKQIVRAVNGVSFSLNYGQTLGLVGETGAGKTSIAKAILRILPRLQSRITSGTIELDGVDLLTLDDDEMRKVRGKRISMIFQDPMTALNPMMRIGDQIAEGIRLHENLSWKEARTKAEELLERVGIPAERIREYPHQFSGGMKQRVVIAIALACNPDLLIADEPTSALDVTIQAQVMQKIKDLQDELNSAMILITHDFGIVAETCDIVAIVFAGQIVEYGTKEQIFLNPLHPYTNGLFNALPDLNKDVRRLKPISGAPPDPTHLPTGCYFSRRCKFATEACKQGEIPIVDVGDGHLCRCLQCVNGVSPDRRAEPSPAD